jgi:hypothetical protein
MALKVMPHYHQINLNLYQLSYNGLSYKESELDRKKGISLKSTTFIWKQI